MADADRCPECGYELKPHAAKGQCPRCLLRQGLDSDALSLDRGGPTAKTVLDPGSEIVRLQSPRMESIGPIPRLLLRDFAAGTEPGPVVQPGSPEMPRPADPAARLQLLGEIARGGMGAILKGRDSDIGRDLAVKVLLEKHSDDPGLIRRFIEEAQIAGQLQHPGVVPVYDLGAFADRRPYFIMKLVKGRTLADLLATRLDPADDQPRVLGIFLQVCQTVAYAHARGVIHRDLKPSNVMVGSFGEVQVMDWGLAKVLSGGAAIADDDRESTIATARAGRDSDLSRAGSVMGTPAYMAPEQARGEIDRVDERVDVFALGSILCEVLTGRPAFTGRSPEEIHRKAAGGDLAEALARLGACGADDELIALARACLAAGREDRPHDAGGLVARLSSYLAGVQERLRAAELARAAESARAEEAQARVVVERSRRRRTVALAASLLAMITLGGLTYAYIAHERQARAAAGERLLGRAATLLDQARDQPDDPARWRTARAAVQQIEDDPAVIGPLARDRLTLLKDEATAGLGDAERLLALRKALVEIRDKRQEAGLETTDAAYAAAFREAGLDIDVLGSPEAARWFRRQRAEVAVELAGYLDHWSGVRRSAGRPPESWRQPLEMARAADPDDYRDRLRVLLLADDTRVHAAQFKSLAGETRSAELPGPTAMLLAGALEGAGEREAAVGLLRRAATRYPDNFTLISALAEALARLTPVPREDVVRFLMAARALRPEAAHDLAHLLDDMGRGDEAIATFRDLVERRGDNSWYLGCMGSCLKAHGRTEEARAVFARAMTLARAALERHPDNAVAHFHVANLLRNQDKLAEAEAEYRAALELQPKHPTAHNNLGNILQDQKRPAEAEVAFRAALKLEPDNAVFQSNLGNVLSTQGKPAEAEAAYRAALRLQPDNSKTLNNLGLILAIQNKPAEAEAAYREALKLKPDHMESHYNLANTLERQGQTREAEAEFREALRIRPDVAEIHCNLGQLLGRSRRFAEALKELRRGHELGSRRPGWSYPSAEWIRQTKRVAGPEVRLPDVLKGEDEPADAAEGLAFAKLCSDRKLHAAAARFYAEALRTDPKLADDRQAWHAYNAAWNAAMAGCGQGKDDPPPDEAARAGLRGQALAWLRGELAAWSRTLDGGEPDDRALLRKLLEHWKADRDLACVRDEAGLAKLPEAERRAWQTLWTDVETLLKKARGDGPEVPAPGH